MGAGKGILAMDESNGTCGKRLDSIGVENTEANRREYRELLLSTPGLGEYIGGAILFEETLYQSGSDGATFVDTLNKQGIIPGIKVDKGLVPMSNSNGESLCQGLDGLSERCAEYYKQGARFAAICQENGLVPIVEPEILLDGEHDIDTTLEIASKTWAQVFKCLADQDVMFEGILLKPSMVTPGADSGTKLAPEVIADYTLKMLNRRVPPAVPGIMFLSGGQSEMESTLNLNAMNQTPNPWHVSFSHGRPAELGPQDLAGPRGEQEGRQGRPHGARQGQLGRAARQVRRLRRVRRGRAGHVREGLHLLSPRTHSSDPRAPHSLIEEPQIQFTLFWTYHLVPRAR